jgi:hypothetical protein
VWQLARGFESRILSAVAECMAGRTFRRTAKSAPAPPEYSRYPPSTYTTKQSKTRRNSNRKCSARSPAKIPLEKEPWHQEIVAWGEEPWLIYLVRVKNRTVFRTIMRDMPILWLFAERQRVTTAIAIFFVSATQVLQSNDTERIPIAKTRFQFNVIQLNNY